MWPIQLTYHRFIACRMFLSSLNLWNTSSVFTRSVQLISIGHQHHISKLSGCFWSIFRSVQISVPHKATLKVWHFTCFFLQFKSNLLVKNLLLLAAAFAMSILDLISRKHFASFVIRLPTYLKYSTFSLCFRSIINRTGDCCLEILIIFGFSTLISTP